MKKEIEVKAKVKDMPNLIASVEKLGAKISDPITQDDAIFINFTTDYSNVLPGQIFLRIRKEKDRTLFTLKQTLKNELDSLEKEVEISNGEELKEALEIMGYHEAVRVQKTRRKAKYNNLEICLDEVKDLGAFIEVEKISDEDSEKVQEELFTFLETLGVKREDRVVNGYDTLIWLKNNPKSK